MLPSTGICARLHRRRREQQDVEALQRRRVLRIQPPAEVPGLRVVVVVVVLAQVGAEQRRELDRDRVVGAAGAPGATVEVDEVGRVMALVVGAERVAADHQVGGALGRDRVPDRQAVAVQRDRDLLDRRARSRQHVGGGAHRRVDVRLGRVRDAEALRQHAHAQTRRAHLERARVLLDAPHRSGADRGRRPRRRSRPASARSRPPSGPSARCGRGSARSGRSRCRARGRASACARSTRSTRQAAGSSRPGRRRAPGRPRRRRPRPRSRSTTSRPGTPGCAG